MEIGLVIDDYEAGTRDREIALYDLGQFSLQMMVAAADLGIGSGHSAVADPPSAHEQRLERTAVSRSGCRFWRPDRTPATPCRSTWGPRAGSRRGTGSC
jgi:hypothetical protein